MPTKVFISYSHTDELWVRETLDPILSAGGAQVIVDYNNFAPGIALSKQISEKQAGAHVHLLVLTPDYFKRKYCLGEMRRAVATDPRFEKGAVLPVILEPCILPPEFRDSDPLHVDLGGSRSLDAEAWEKLMKACNADVGCSAAEWVQAFRTILQRLRGRRSVNLSVISKTVNGKGVKWRELIEQLQKAFPELGIQDLQSGQNATRRLLIEGILRECAGYSGRLPREDLAELERVLLTRDHTWLALFHFDLIREKRDKNFNAELFSSLRYLIMEKKKLTLLIGSQAPFASLLPNHKLSEVDMESVVLAKKDVATGDANTLIAVPQTSAINSTEQPTVWVLGSYSGLNEQELTIAKKLIAVLGGSLATNRMRLVSGRSDMLEDLSTYCRRVTESLRPPGTNPVMIEGKLRRKSLTKMFQQTICRIPNLAVVIGGSVARRVQEECECAEKAGIPVLPVPVTGGHAARAKLTAVKAKDLYTKLSGSNGVIEISDLVEAILAAVERYTPRR